jgi:hypothetical protein
MVDRIPKVGYVATHFLHFHLIPLIPMRSYLVLEPYRADHRFGWPIPLSRKSVLMAWLRPAFLCAVGVSALATLIAVDDVKGKWSDDLPSMLSAAALMASILLCAFSILSNRAGFARAVELGARFGIEPLDMEQILATSRQSLLGLTSWYFNSFDGLPKLPPPDWTKYGLQSLRPARKPRAN